MLETKFAFFLTNCDLFFKAYPIAGHNVPWDPPTAVCSSGQRSAKEHGELPPPVDVLVPTRIEYGVRA